MRTPDRFDIERAARQAQAREIARLVTLAGTRIATLGRLVIASVRTARLQRAQAHRTVLGR